MRCFRRARRVWGTLLAVAIVIAASLTCLNGTAISAEDHDCCAAMAAQCGGSMATQHGCCSTETADQAFQQIGGSRPVAIEKPVAALVATLDFVEPSRIVAVTTVTSLQQPRGSPPRLPGVPTYLAISTFRL